jgi:PAS domain S-box-containing protein
VRSPNAEGTPAGLPSEDEIYRLAQVVLSTRDAVLSKNLDGIVTSWNPAAERLYGYSESEAVGQPVNLIVPPELHAAEREVLARVARGERLEPFETVRVARGGQRLDVSLTLSPILGEGGAIVGASSISRDIGRQKQLEQSLREADRRKDDFLALLAHELRNPLAPIWNSVAAMQMAAPDDPRLRHATDVIARQARHMARMLDDLLDMSRITRDKLDLQKESVPLLRVLELALETSRPIIDANRQLLTVEVHDRSIVVYADTMRLAQAFSNLVSNASKYSPPQSTVRVAVTRDGADAVVTVEARRRRGTRQRSGRSEAGAP